MKDKKILWIVTELFPPDETSTAYILGEIANAFVEKYQVKIICGPKMYDKQKKIDDNSKYVLNSSIEIFRTASVGLDKNTILGKLLGFFFVSYQLIMLVKRYVKKNDKVLVVTNPALLVVLMSRLKRKKGFELNVLVHDIFPENTIPAGLKLPGYSLFKHIFDKAYGDADQLIVLGRDMKNIMLQKVAHCNKNIKISIVENWAEIEEIKQRPFPENRKIILEYAGNIGRVQALDEVIKQLPEEIEFHLYGTGAFENKLKKMKSPNVFFHGPYFRSQQDEVLSICDIALVTLQVGMYGLGVPSKAYNILASGRPILFIGPKDSEIDLLVREEGIGYCGWPQVWNKEELVVMGNRARKLAERNYSKKMILNKFLEII